MQGFEDPFGDSPFKALPSTASVLTPQQFSAPTDSFQPTMNQNAEPPQPPALKADTVSNLDFGDTLSGLTYSGPSVSSIQPPANMQYLPQELSISQQNSDILADILPPPGPTPAFTSQQAFSGPTGQPVHPTANIYGTLPPQAVPVAPQNQAGTPAQFSSGSFLPQGVSTSLPTSHMAPEPQAGPTAQLNGGIFFPQQGGSPITSHMAPQASSGPAVQFNGTNFLPPQAYSAPAAAHLAHQMPTGPAVLPNNNNDVLGNLLPQAGPNTPMTSQQNLPSSTGSLSIVPQPAKDKFETKSTVWADTLSRGLVNLNISGCECFIHALFLVALLLFLIYYMTLGKGLVTNYVEHLLTKCIFPIQLK